MVLIQTRGHSAKLMKTRCQLDIRRFFFSERVIDRWNSLDQYAMDSGTVNVLKNRLDRIRTTRIGFSKGLPVASAMIFRAGAW